MRKASNAAVALCKISSNGAAVIPDARNGDVPLDVEKRKSALLA